MRVSVFVVIVWVATTLVPGSAVADPLVDCSSMLKYTGAPVYSGPPEHHEVLCRKGYVLLYNGDRRVPDWVLEVLTTARLQGDAVRRDNFKKDPDLPADQAAALSDYRGTGYDRGHMAPAGDMKWNQDAMDQSFYLSNMAPQVGIGFNRNIWKNLEEYVRDLPKEREPLVVITGPVYYGTTRTMVSTDKACERTCRDEACRSTCSTVTDVSIPSAFYKIVYWPARKRVLAFELPNAKLSGEDFADFRTTVDKIEADTGLDFLASLSHRDQNRLERLKSPKWKVYQ